MKTYRLSPLEQLKLEEKQLREQIKISEQKMTFQLQHIQDNLGAIILKSTTSSIMNKFTDRTGSFSSSSNASYLTKSARTRSGWSDFFLSNYKSFASTGWRLLKPIAITFLTKKITGKIFNKKRKK